MTFASANGLLPIEAFAQCEREKSTDLHVVCDTKETPRLWEMLVHVSSWLVALRSAPFHWQSSCQSSYIGRAVCEFLRLVVVFDRSVSLLNTHAGPDRGSTQPEGFYRWFHSCYLQSVVRLEEPAIERIYRRWVPFRAIWRITGRFGEVMGRQRRSLRMFWRQRTISLHQLPVHNL